MSRTVPAVSERFVVSLGPMCHVTCLEARTRKAGLEIRPRQAVRRDRAAVVRRAVPVD